MSCLGKLNRREELIKTENINVYKRKNNSYVSRSVLLRKSVFDGLYELKNKFRIPIYLLVNIAIRNVLIEEGLLQRCDNGSSKNLLILLKFKL